TIEVVNLGMTAVNTYTVRDFARECLSYQPDALIIYSGHNEFYGALGTGSSQRPFWGSNRSLTLAYIALKKTRLFQLWTHLEDWFRQRHPGRAPTQTLMARMAREQTIPLDSPLVEKTARIFQQNLEDICHWTREAGIPLFLGTLVSNLKDQPPFVSIPPPGRTEPELDRDIRRRLEGRSQVQEKSLLDSLKRIYPGYARVYYAAGKVEEQLGDWSAAREAYRQARDLDGLRFRAPTRFNEILTTLAETEPQVFLVPVEARFAHASPHGLIGQELIWEHLHPNLKGYFLMAAAFGQALETWFPHSRTVPEDSLFRSIAVTGLDSALARYRIQILTAGWPFHPEHRFLTAADLQAGTVEDSLAIAVLTHDSDYEKAHVSLAQTYLRRGQWQRAAREYRVLATTFPYSESPWLALGHILVDHRRFREALPVLETVLTLTPDAFAAKWAGAIRLQQGDPGRALGLLQQAERLNPRDPQVLYNLSGAYFLSGDTTRALTTVERALDLAPHDPAAKAFHRKLKAALSQP
ncbi:MAG: hypothetical protein D6762_04180, partial [Candidatus Neomarinimicrobiota bacterium]